jgi:hypothetical protein
MCGISFAHPNVQRGLLNTCDLESLARHSLHPFPIDVTYTRLKEGLVIELGRRLIEEL